MKIFILLCLTLNLAFAEEEKMTEPPRFNGTRLIKEAQAKNIRLTEKEESILEIGEVSQTRYILGGVLGTYPLGFGIGHAVQGTWGHKGYIFTAGELGALGLILIGLSSDCDRSDGYYSCRSSSTITFGVLGFIGLRIWEIVDVWAGVPSYRDKQEELRRYIEGKDYPEKKVSFNFAPIYNSELSVPGLGLQMRF